MTPKGIKRMIISIVDADGERIIISHTAAQHDLSALAQLACSVFSLLTGAHRPQYKPARPRLLQPLPTETPAANLHGLQNRRHSVSRSP